MQENLIDNTYVANYAPELDLSQFSTTTISGMITQASANVRNYCSVDGFLQSAVVSERGRANINSQGDLIISFLRRPVSQGDVSAVRLRTVSVNQSLTLQSGGSDIYFIPDPGTYMSYPSNYLISFGRGLMALRGANLFYEVDYTGGYTQGFVSGYQTVPEDLKEATLLYLRDLLSKRFNPTGMDMFRQGSMQVQTSRGNGLSMFVAQARDILDRSGYKRIVP